MTLPVNSSKAKNTGCTPVSSNCVVWQGPDLYCIGVCKGDTISDVVANLAEQLCILIDQFDLGKYDFSCLQVPVSERPDNLAGLIQILINRICILEGLPYGEGDTQTSDCPDNCIVSIAECFHYVNSTGDTVTTMSLIDYVTTIGNIICDMLDDIATLQTNYTNLQLQVNGDGSAGQLGDAGGVVGAIVDIRDNYAPTDSLQFQVSSNINPGAGTQYITDALRTVETSLVQTQTAMGSQTSLYQNILKEDNLSNAQRMFGSGTMNTLTGWTNNVQTAADSIGNIWTAIKDIRQAVDYMQENCCATTCSDIFLNFRASINVQATTTFLTVFTDGSTGFTNDWKECSNDTRITVADALGNTTTFRTSLISLIDTPSGYQVDITATSIDPTVDITVTAETCFTNTSTNTTCEKDYEYAINATTDCPSVVITSYSTSMNYQFTAVAGQTYIAKVYYNGGGISVAEQIISTPGVIVLQSIIGLLSETDYEFELTVVSPSNEETVCTKIGFTTLASACVPPTNASATLTT